MGAIRNPGSLGGWHNLEGGDTPTECTEYSCVLCKVFELCTCCSWWGGALGWMGRGVGGGLSTTRGGEIFFLNFFTTSLTITVESKTLCKEKIIKIEIFKILC